MLHEFLSTHRAELIERCRVKVAQRRAPHAELEHEHAHGIPTFLDQLVETLRADQAAERMRDEDDAASPSGRSKFGEAATLHGREMSKDGFTVDQVVHNYGDFCQVVTELAIEDAQPIAVEEFKTLNRCLDDAIAGAVNEFSFQHQTAIVDEGGRSLDERLRLLAHELRGHIKTATLAVTAIRDGHVGLKGATGTLLDLSLMSLRSAIDRSLADAWATAGLPARHHLISLADFIAQVKMSTAFEARARRCTFTVADVDPELAVDADNELLLSAVGQLLQNAFRFTAHRTEVSLAAYATGNRILIEVADHCGGLTPGVVEPVLTSSGTEPRCAHGEGLAMCRRSVEANNGELKVRDVPGKGCIFTIDLPRRALQ